MALNKDFIGKGMSDITFKLIEKLCLEKDIHNIRVDTHSSNKRMQHVFKRNSFKQCGVIIYQGGDRLAFDKKLVKNYAFFLKSLQSINYKKNRSNLFTPVFSYRQNSVL